MAAKKSASSASQSARPFAESVAPANIRVDPGSAASEYMKSLLGPEAPVPVFSTMALVHGKEAAAATALREGFAWNPQMDLLWALGYPEVLLIVDGFPGEDTPEATLAYWDPEKKCTLEKGGAWHRHALATNPRILSRRGAWAAIWELEQKKSPFRLDQEAFMAATQPRELSSTEGYERMLAASWHKDVIDRAAKLIEALAGPDCVADALCALAADAKRDVEIRRAAVASLRPLLRRLTDANRATVLSRVEAVADAPNELAESILLLTNPMQYAEKRISAGREQYALVALAWIDGSEELVQRCHRASLAQRPDRPSPRTIFPGGRGVIEQEVAHFKKYDAQDVAIAYLNDYTTVRDPLFVGPALQLLSSKDVRGQMSAWFEGHAAELRPALEALAAGEDAKLGKAAATLLKKL